MIGISKTPSSQKNIRDGNSTFLNRSCQKHHSRLVWTSGIIYLLQFMDIQVGIPFSQRWLFGMCNATGLQLHNNPRACFKLQWISNERRRRTSARSSAHIGIHIEFTTSFSFTPEKEARARGQRKNFLWTWCHHLHHITIFSFRIFCLTLWPAFGLYYRNRV